VRVVGLTGGIGSGKSTLSAELRDRHGVPVIDADEAARRCVEPGTTGHAAIVRRFGTDVLHQDGSLDRAALAAIVFRDSSARQDLERITHPCIRAEIERRLVELRALDPSPPFAVVEHPLLVETGSHAGMDLVVVVEAPIDLRVARLVGLRGMDEAEARRRIAAQADDAQRRAVADHVVVNDGDPAALRAQIQPLLERIGAADGLL